MAAQFAAENGIVGAVNALYKHLPYDTMLCEVSLLRYSHWPIEHHEAFPHD